MDYMWVKPPHYQAADVEFLINGFPNLNRRYSETCCWAQLLRTRSAVEDMCPFVHDVNEVKGKNHMFTFYLEQTTYWDYSTKNWEQYQKALQLVVVGHLWEGVKSHELSRPYAKKNT